MAESRSIDIVETRNGPMLVDAADIYVGRSLSVYGEFSPGEVALLGQLLKPSDTVVEAGAHVGSHTLWLARCVGPMGRVYAFEPQRPLFHMLCGSLALNGMTHVEAWPAGLGAEIAGNYKPHPALL